MTVRIESETINTASGTLFAQGEGRIEINDIRLEAVPDGHMLLICNRDMPEAVGKIGMVLGSAGVNISRMQLGLGKDGGDALAVVNIDGVVPHGPDRTNDIEQVVSVDSVGSARLRIRDMTSRAWVTGASRGIGKAVALKLAKDGFDLTITYRSNEALALSVVEEISCGVDARAVCRSWKFDRGRFSG